MLITVCIFIRYNAVTKYITGDQDNDVRFDVFMAVKIQDEVFRVVTLCSAASIFRVKWRQQGPLKH